MSLRRQQGVRMVASMAKRPDRPAEALQAEREWSRQLTAAIGEQLKRHRGRMSAKQLADRCEELGYRVEQQVIANMEFGRRTSVSVAELLVLARALNVPPALLVAPVGQNATVSPLPQVTSDGWGAFQWVTGEMPIPPAAPHDFDQFEVWKGNQAPIELFRRHEAAVSAYRDADREPDEDRRRREVRLALLELARVRRDMATNEVEPPALPEDLANRLPDVPDQVTEIDRALGIVRDRKQEER